MRLNIFCGLLLNLRTEILRFPETLCFDFFPKEKFWGRDTAKKMWEVWCKFAAEIQKENTKNHKRYFRNVHKPVLLSGEADSHVFRTGISRVVQGHPLPYFTYATTRTNKTIIQHYYSYLVACSAHWSRPATQTIEQWSYCVFLNLLPRPPGDLKTQLFFVEIRRGQRQQMKKWLIWKMPCTLSQ